MFDVEAVIRTGNKSLDDYRVYINQVMTIQGESVRRLAASDTPPIEMAAVLEDIANTFLDLSEEIREIALNRRSESSAAR